MQWHESKDIHPMYQDTLNDSKIEFEEAIERYSGELKNLRTGRATPALVEDLKVDYFGTKTPLKQMASITVADSRSIVISPWSKDSLVDIEKSINESDLGISPNNDGNVIRLNLPSLTEERRKELVKVLNKKTEEARIRIRQVREDVWKNIQKQEDAGEISEDDKFRAKDKLQEIVDEYNKKVESLEEKKEQEIMQI